eukprot:TRINITY_DN7933_c0_g2_i2.p1 TRINITY_DN7933_c0_g2~~TRINITY_DN7933_c0_g2_i2.p1  ORF type:complete len:429 (+),score=75.43 TRINITY_DN7933_c0_g2_i2:267-1553(+)
MMADSARPPAWMISVTARAPSNIAVIKYWGKRDEALVLPLNSSLSVTLDPDNLAATTSVAASPLFQEDRFWLNGKLVSLAGIRHQNCLRELRRRATDVKDERSGRVVTQEEWQQLKLHIVSENNFPTAAGLASSAAGFACLVYALAQLMGVKEAYPGELSAIARLGSGSACRSLYGGFVKWHMGQEAGGRDSIAEQVASSLHWPDLVIIIAVVSSSEKETSSTAGMQQSVRTSPLLHFRAQEIVPGRMEKMETAIRTRDFGLFAALTCADSNQFHATCLDTAPPIFYLTDTSRRIIGLVERWNEQQGRPMAAYTFDAGPNAVLFTESANAGALLRRLLFHFPPQPHVTLKQYVVGNLDILKAAAITDVADISSLPPPDEAPSAASRWRGDIQYFISTQPGAGAHMTSLPSDSLLDMRTGLPLRTSADL